MSFQTGLPRPVYVFTVLFEMKLIWAFGHLGTSIITLKIERNNSLFVSGGALDISLQRNISQYLHSHLQNKKMGEFNRRGKAKFTFMGKKLNSGKVLCCALQCMLAFQQGRAEEKH